MDSHDKEFFDRLMALTEENNQMLRRMRKIARWTGIVRLTYWIVLIGASIGAFYFLQPYIDEMKVMYENAKNSVNSVQQLVNPNGGSQ